MSFTGENISNPFVQSSTELYFWVQVKSQVLRHDLQVMETRSEPLAKATINEIQLLVT